MRYNAKPAESYINACAWGFSQMGDSKLAEALLNLNIKNYLKSDHFRISRQNFVYLQGD